MYYPGQKRENQDAVCCGRSSRYSVISLADGVSSCKRAGQADGEICLR